MSFVKEIPERKIHGGKANLVNNAVVGFFAGICAGSGWIKVAYYANGKPKLAETSSCMRLSGFYMERARPGSPRWFFEGRTWR